MRHANHIGCTLATADRRPLRLNLVANILRANAIDRVHLDPTYGRPNAHAGGAFPNVPLASGARDRPSASAHRSRNTHGLEAQESLQPVVVEDEQGP